MTMPLPGEETRTDMTVPRKDVEGLPIISGEAYQHLGRASGALVLSAFEMIGGLTRFANWADSNPTDFYTKLFPKLIQRSQSVDISGSVTIDDAIARLERNTIEGEFFDVTPAPRPQAYDL